MKRICHPFLKQSFNRTCSPFTHSRCLSTKDSEVTKFSKPKKPPVKVAVTGAAGQIGYSLLFRLASGEMLGPDQPVHIHAIELPHAMNALKGVAMELEDCAFPLLSGIVQTDDSEKGFEDVDYALLVGAKPRGPGQERADLLKENGGIFKAIGQALDKTAKKSVKVTVVGNPANTNCMICAHHAPSIPDENFTAMMRLDHDRALHQVAVKTGHHVNDFTEFVVWGNHSPTMFPDLTFTRIFGTDLRAAIGNNEIDEWVENEFIPAVQQRGTAVIAARGHSSAASAASACISQTRDWALGNDGRWVSMGVKSNGEYGIPKGLWSGFPLECEGNGYRIVPDLPLTRYQEEKIAISVKELDEEFNAVAELLS